MKPRPTAGPRSRDRVAEAETRCDELAAALRDAHAYIQRLQATTSVVNFVALVMAAAAEQRRANANAELAWQQRQAALAAEGVPGRGSRPKPWTGDAA